MAVTKLLNHQSRWHPLPAYHLKAPRGWMNDPCAPGYDPSTGTYHLFYQWNPQSCDWGDICWGHFTSRDGLRWEHNGTNPALEPSEVYDEKGMFTGCMHPTGPRGEKGQLTLVYSSITSLPIHWTIPYTRNCAGLALATSQDGGRTWEKSTLNPILGGEPPGLDVTGFRDPFLAEWPALDALRRTQGKQIYGFVSGGIVNRGPNVFVYAISPDDLTSWTYIGPLVNLQVGFNPSERWTGDYGVNWECVNFVQLGSGAEACDFLLMGTEGGLRRDDIPRSKDAHQTWTLWMAGNLKRDNAGVVLEYDYGGILDHGSFYAPNSYRNPDTGVYIIWGWIKEEELTLARRELKGWTGYLSIPREIFLQRLHNVIRALKTPLHEISSISTSAGRCAGDDNFTVQTLGIRPLPSLKGLRQHKPSVWLNIEPPSGDPHLLTTPISTNWELEAFIKIQPGHTRVGLEVRHSHDRASTTSIYFSPEAEEIVVDKTLSNDVADIQKDAVRGPHTLFVLDKDGTEVLEELHLRIFSDGDVLEVFANNRFALSTTVYSDAHDCLGISCFSEGQGVRSAGFGTVMLWENLESVQPALAL